MKPSTVINNTESINKEEEKNIVDRNLINFSNTNTRALKCLKLNTQIFSESKRY